jgi:hypothetical protein
MIFQTLFGSCKEEVSPISDKELVFMRINYKMQRSEMRLHTYV